MATGTSGIPVVTVRGALGNVVFQRSGDTLMVRERVVPHDPKTAGQLAARAAMDRAGALWHALSDAEFAAWTLYAAAEGGTAYRLFVGLTLKWLRVHPGGNPPTTPPAGPFFGDAVTVSLPLGRGRGGVESVAEDETTPTLPSPRGEGDSPRLVLTASQPNAQGVVTEILVQPLANARRKPRARDWKGAAFVTFASGSLAVPVSLPKGAYAVAYRFVCAATGQATAMATLGATVV